MELKNKHLYLLLISISEYLLPEVPNLPGCRKDKEKVKQFFIDKIGVPPTQVIILSDKDATRQNIIDTFRKRFTNLPEGATVILHFSGHGSWEKTSAEFIEAGIEAPGGRNETLVPYDGGGDGVLNIADKELRLLISEFQSVKPVSFIALMDCCHSSSQFRGSKTGAKSSIFRSRLRPGSRDSRALKDYLQGQFVSMTPILLPDIDYVSISACASHEYALEEDGGGVFTTALIDLLDKYLSAGKWPSYATLFGALNTQILNQAGHRQHPQFEYKGDFDPADSFLGLAEATTVDLLPVVFDEKEGWIAPQGLIGGLDAGALIGREVLIYQRQEENNGLKQASRAKVLRVGLEKTILDLPQITGGIDAHREALFVELPFYGLSVEISDKVDVDFASQLRTFFSSPSLYRFYEAPSASVSISCNDKNSVVLSTEAPAVELIFIDEKKAYKKLLKRISGYLMQITRWHGLLSLNPSLKTRINPYNLAINIRLKSLNWSHSTRLQNGQTIDTPYSLSGGPIIYSVHLTNENKFKISTYLFRLGRHYEIQQLHENHGTPFYPFGGRMLYNSREAGVGLGITDPQIQETYDEFIVLVCKAPLTSPHHFEQPGLPRNGEYDLDRERGFTIKKPVLKSPSFGVFRFRVRCYRADEATT